MRYQHLKLHVIVIMKMARLVRSRRMMRMITTMVVMVLVTRIVDVDALVRELVRYC